MRRSRGVRMASLFDDDIEIDALDAMITEVDADLPAAPEEVPQPRANPDFFGHDEIEKRLLADIIAGRLPHAIILAGLPGIGKATLAYRLARFLLAGGADNALLPPENLALSSTHPIFRRVVSGGHADLLTVEREYDEKKGRFKNDISVEAARRIHPFLQKTAAEGGWRVVIVDSAEYMNTSGQNAILKILEEPPEKTLLILTTSQPGMLLPTIRSRCRLVPMQPLSRQVIVTTLDKFAPTLTTKDKTAIADLADGSMGRALQLNNDGGLALYRKLLDAVATMPRLDMLKVHELSETLGKYGAEPQFEAATGILAGWCARQALAEAKGVLAKDTLAGDAEIFARLSQHYPRGHFVSAREKIMQLAWQTDVYNLDRKQAVMAAFLALQNPDYQGLNT